MASLRPQLPILQTNHIEWPSGFEIALSSDDLDPRVGWDARLEPVEETIPLELPNGRSIKLRTGLQLEQRDILTPTLSQTMKQRSLLVLIILAMYEENWVEPNFNPSYVPFMSYVLLESKAQTMAQFKSTLLDLHALLQVFVIYLAHVKNVRSPLIL